MSVELKQLRENLVGTIYAYRYPHSDPEHDDPHTVELEVTLEDIRAYTDQAAGSWTKVTDRATGNPWYVRRADCGQGCYCAAEASDVDPEADTANTAFGI